MSIPATRDQLKEWCKEYCTDNKYACWYFNIIDNALLRNSQKSKELYVENHHIIPKSILKNNFSVNLTAREHFICHLLLPKFLKQKNHLRKMQLAVHRLIHGNKNITYCKSARLYEVVKKWHSSAASTRTILYWNNFTQEEKSLMRSGKNNGRYGKYVTKETKLKISRANKGRLSREKHPLWCKGHSEETKRKMSIDTILSERNKGKNNPMFGKIGAAKNKKWYNDPINKIEKYYVAGTQPSNFIQGRLKNVYTNN